MIHNFMSYWFNGRTVKNDKLRCGREQLWSTLRKWGGEGTTKCQGNLPLGKRNMFLMLVLYFQNTIIKMIQYKQKQQMHVIKQLMPVQNYTPCQVKKKKII
jgi:hypothetical protein